MKAEVVKDPSYMAGYPWLVYVTTEVSDEKIGQRLALGGSYEQRYIDSWHKTKRQAEATARDIGVA